jgi:small subunit ribosomal protein S3e
MVSTGQPKLEFIDEAVRHVELRQGVLGVKVKVMQDNERAVGKYRKAMPDYVKIHDPKDEVYEGGPAVINTYARE